MVTITLLKGTSSSSFFASFTFQVEVVKQGRKGSFFSFLFSLFSFLFSPLSFSFSCCRLLAKEFLVNKITRVCVYACE